ncbi:MAG: hypothetical protein SX243_09450 [Acidobacteriota bacterium]|nr:hypothetical protein [Acidobacteriota bacterium]
MASGPRSRAENQLRLFGKPQKQLADAAENPAVRVPAALRSHLGEPADEFFHKLHRRLPGNLAKLTLTNNRSTIVSTRPTPDGFDVRVHWCFAGAPEPVLEALGRVAAGERRGKPQALAVLREHFRGHWEDRRQAPADSPAPPRPRRRSLRAEGQCFDLREIRDRINHQYFENRLEVAIGWGKSPSPPRRRKRRRRQSIHLGTFRPLPAGPEQGLIRIHPVLDRVDVPLYVVESVVHHEMLHADLPATVVGGRRRLHTPEFRRREALYVHYHQARAWIDAHLDQLLTQRYRR